MPVRAGPTPQKALCASAPRRAAPCHVRRPAPSPQGGAESIPGELREYLIRGARGRAVAALTTVASTAIRNDLTSRPASRHLATTLPAGNEASGWCRSGDHAGVVRVGDANRRGGSGVAFMLVVDEDAQL